MVDVGTAYKYIDSIKHFGIKEIGCENSLPTFLNQLKQ
jgi:hypothetical protein